MDAFLSRVSLDKPRQGGGPIFRAWLCTPNKPNLQFRVNLPTLLNSKMDKVENLMLDAGP